MSENRKRRIRKKDRHAEMILKELIHIRLLLELQNSHLEEMEHQADIACDIYDEYKDNSLLESVEDSK